MFYLPNSFVFNVLFREKYNSFVEIVKKLKFSVILFEYVPRMNYDESKRHNIKT